MAWHLAIETSGRAGSVALLDGDNLISEIELPPEGRTTATLAPVLQGLKRQIGSDSTIELISVVDGPGSFTGLRIGVTAAKTLCFAWDSALVCVDALAVICEQVRQDLLESSSENLGVAEVIAVCTNAYRGQVFMRSEPIGPQDDSMVGESKIVDEIVFRDFVERHRCVSVGREAERISSDFRRTSDGWPRPMAATVGQLAWKMYQSGRRDDHWTLTPRYLRKSAAEEKADTLDSQVELGS